jgi:biopolymer transport protein ExbD
MKLTPLERRAERQSRNQTGIDMNLVALIDIFTILIFFLLSSAAGVELLPSSKAVQLPQSTADKSPKETIVVVVSAEDIVVDGRRVASVAEALQGSSDVIAPLKAELDLLSASRQVVREENRAQAQAVTIMGDKAIPFSLLRRVMVTAARANFTDVSFAVIQKDVS